VKISFLCHVKPHNFADCNRRFDGMNCLWNTQIYQTVHRHMTGDNSLQSHCHLALDPSILSVWNHGCYKSCGYWHWSRGTFSQWSLILRIIGDVTLLPGEPRRVVWGVRNWLYERPEECDKGNEVGLVTRAGGKSNTRVTNLTEISHHSLMETELYVLVLWQLINLHCSFYTDCNRLGINALFRSWKVKLSLWVTS
jgi:hypothetical protein